MKQFNGLKQRFGILIFGLMLTLGLIAGDAVGAAQGSGNPAIQPGTVPPTASCQYVACPNLPAITNVHAKASATFVGITFDMDMSGDPLWGQARVDILKNGQIVASDTQFAAPSGLRHMTFVFTGLEMATQYQFKIYREVGADSYVPHLTTVGTFHTL